MPNAGSPLCPYDNQKVLIQNDIIGYFMTETLFKSLSRNLTLLFI